MVFALLNCFVAAAAARSLAGSVTNARAPISIGYAQQRKRQPCSTGLLRQLHEIRPNAAHRYVVKYIYTHIRI